MLELNKCYNENCLDTMSKMPDNFIDLTVTSPPYDNLRTYNGYSFNFESIAKELFRVTKQGGVVVWVVGDATVKGSETGTSFKQALYFKEIGFNLHDTMIWCKDNAVPTQHTRYQNAMEYMFIFSKGSPLVFNKLQEPTKHPGTTHKKHRAVKSGHLNNNEGSYTTKDTKLRNNWWIISCGSTVRGHGATFPESLANDHIISWSNEGDIIYDPFMGSGTTAKMAILNKRQWVGSEMSSEYCEIIQKRVESISVLI